MSALAFLAALAAIAVLVWRSRVVTIIYPSATGLLYRDGRFERALPPGRHVWFDPGSRRKVFRISLAEAPITLPEVTVLSKDQFSFRVALSPVVRITDARAYLESQPIADPHPLVTLMPAIGSHASLAPVMAAAALGAAGAHTLADIIANPALLPEAVQARVAAAIPGATIGEVLLTAINLPPETRRMFTEVERARLEAQGALERARGEHAALRVLANAARLVNDNPSLASLRMLQAIENSKGSTTIVLGEGVLGSTGLTTRPTAQG